MAVASVAVWERRLKNEGLAPVDSPVRHRAEKLTDISGVRPLTRPLRSPDPQGADAVEAWTAWARGVLASHRFTCDAQRKVWRLYAEGVSITKIRARAKLSRMTVMYHVRCVKDVVPPAPGPNPWANSTGPKSRRTAAQRTPNDPQLLALLRQLLESRKDPMAKGEKIHYTRVVLNRGEEVEIRNIAKTSSRKGVLLDIDGYRHAGGIDFEFDTKVNGSGETRLGKLTVTVPWHMIKQADVEVEVSET